MVAFLIPGDQPPTAARSEQHPAALVPKLWLLSAGLVATVLAATSIGALGAAGGVEVGLTEGERRLPGGARWGLRRSSGWVRESARIGGHSIPCERSPGCVCSGGGLVPDGQWDSVAVRHRAGGGQCLRLGWPGLQHLAVAQRFPSSTAAASGSPRPVWLPACSSGPSPWAPSRTPAGR